jgi:hypothetical protein
MVMLVNMEDQPTAVPTPTAGEPVNPVAILPTKSRVIQPSAEFVATMNAAQAQTIDTVITPQPETVVPSAPAAVLAAPQPQLAPVIAQLAVPAAPPVAATPSPVVQPFTPAPVEAYAASPVVGGSSANSRALGSMQGSPHRFWMIAVTASLIAVLVVAVVYFLVLPLHFSSAYQSRIKPAYASQSASMNAVYQSFKDPVYSNGQSATASSSVFRSSNQAVSTAIQQTNQLSKTADMTVLPLTTMLSAAHKARLSQISVEQYTSNSTAFLKDYQQLNTYLIGFNQADMANEPKLTATLSTLNKSTTPAQFESNLQLTETVLTTFVSALKELHPSPDLVPFNTSIINDLQDFNTSFEGIQAGVSNSSASEIDQSTAQLQQTSVPY